MLVINREKMKLNKINIILLLVVGLFIVSCAKDNYEQPNASLKGVLRDKTSGEPIPGVVGNGNFGDLQFFQLDYGVDNPSGFSIAGFKSDGTYANATLFSGQYKLVPRGPYFYQDTVVVELVGDMSVDLNVIPFVDVELSLVEATSNSITVNVKAKRGEGADEIVQQKISQVVALLGTTAGVNYNNYYVVNNNTSDYRYVVNTSAIENEVISVTEYTYTFKNLKANTNYYLRGASRVSNNNPSNYYNYSDVLTVKTAN